MRSLKSNSDLIDSLINNNRGLSIIIILLKAVFYSSVIETVYYNIIILEIDYGQNENNSINTVLFDIEWKAQSWQDGLHYIVLE